MTLPLSVEQADEELSSYQPRIADSIKNGWDRWCSLLKLDSELGAIISTRSRASLVYDFIRHEAITAFGDDPEVVISEERSFLLLTSKSNTRQADEYAHQVLPGFQGLTHLVAGYLPDKLGLKLDRAAITCVLGDDLKWHIDLDLGIEDDGVVAPVIPVQPTAPQTGTIIRPRREEGTQSLPDQRTSEER